MKPIQKTLFLTLYAPGCDSRLPNSILNDKASGDLVQRLDYDFTRFKASPSVVSGTALRARKIDDRVRAFCAQHPDGIVLDLGCGLDTRMLRRTPPPGVDWYDVDYAEVIGHSVPSPG